MDDLLFTVFSFIGTVAFALSGAVTAMNEDYDILGIFILGLVTAFGGGVIRNLLIGIPPTSLWSQSFMLNSALISITIILIVPVKWIHTWLKVEVFFDAIGLAAFAVQGAMYAVSTHQPVIAVVFAAMMTGIGGGIVRDVLAGRKPVVFREDLYAIWAITGGLIIGLGWARASSELWIIFAFIVVMRLLSFKYKWKLPKRHLYEKEGAKG